MARLYLRLLPMCCALALLALALSGCAPNAGATSTQPTTPPHGYALKRCSGQIVPIARVVAPLAPPSVYVGSVGGSLYAFAAQDGATRWCNRFSITVAFPCPRSCPAPPQAIVGKPLLAGNVVYVCVSGYGGVTYAFNASDGALRWQRETDCEIVDIPFADYAQPILANGLLYTGKYALNPNDGSIRWQMPMQATVGAVVGDVIYAYTQDMVYALSAGSGAVRWQYKLSAPIGDVPTIAGRKVYVGDINGDSAPYTPGQPDTHALEASNGSLLWSYPTGVIASSSAVVSNGVVYIGSFEAALYALDATTGALRWRYQTGTSVESTPIISNGTLYFTSDGAYALNANDGTLRWHNALGANQSTSFTLATLLKGILYLGQTDGSGNSTLYALDASSGAALWHAAGINQLSPPLAG
jgi:outer membrane protein assembly factor BamB